MFFKMFLLYSCMYVHYLVSGELCKKLVKKKKVQMASEPGLWNTKLSNISALWRQWRESKKALDPLTHWRSKCTKVKINLLFITQPRNFKKLKCENQISDHLWPVWKALLAFASQLLDQKDFPPKDLNEQ